MANVTVIHKDIRTYAFREELYYRACQLGVKFLRYPVDDELPAYDGNVVKAYDATLGAEVEIPVDTVILAAGIAPDTPPTERTRRTSPRWSRSPSPRTDSTSRPTRS